METRPVVQYKYLLLLAMLYLTVDLACLALTYKFVLVGVTGIGFIKTSIEIFIFPLTYTITDIITEVYGYQTARKVIWLVFLCDFLFALITFFMVKVHSPDQIMQKTYDDVFASLLRGSLAETVGVLCGIFANVYLVSKFKVIAQGKYFWLRSIGGASTGEAILVIIAVPIIFWGKLGNSDILTMIVSTYIYKVIFAIVISVPASIVAQFLKLKENIDVYDYNVKFNPFLI
ncbi:MAG: Conserved hypothetical rane protein [Burkholderiales bacterium]|jgi:uncharacterized integral membrane protein (TIGR00697 family)|nr:Conserved hypothetical rane protein [Burkholderiales bacterium]